MKIKQLEWRVSIPLVSQVATPLCLFYEASLDENGTAYLFVGHSGGDNGTYAEIPGTIEDAKRAAQADFERRVMEWIEPGVSLC